MIHNQKVKWIWSDINDRSKDCYKLFRASFTLDKVPEGTSIEIAVDSTFALYVNGKRIPCGQFSDYPEARTYSTIDISEYLSTGKNTVAVSVHYLGDKFHVYIPGVPALRAAVFAGEKLLAFTSKTWKCAPDPALLSGSERKLTFQAGYIFEYNAQYENCWQIPDFDDSNWSFAEEYVDFPATLEPRPVPQLAELLPPETRLSFSGLLFRRREYECPAESCYNDYMRSLPLLESLELDFLNDDQLRWRRQLEFKNDSGEFIKFRPIPSDSCANGFFAVFDLGREEVGYIRFRFHATAGTVVDIAHGEHLDNGRVLVKHGKYNFCDRYICKEGLNDYLYPHRRLGCRYIELHITQNSGEFAINYVGLTPLQLPLPPESRFETEDSELARLNRLGRRTMMLCMHEHYEDCPWREQALWNFDTRIQMFLGYHVWGNYDFAAASLRLMQKSYCDGFLALTEPGRGDGRTIPSFSLAYIVGLRDLLLYGGNLDQVVGHLDTVDGILDFGLAHRDKNGLFFIEENKRFWNFYEWIGQLYSLNEFPQSLWNLYFCEAMKAAGFINRVCGRKERADFLEKNAAELGITVEKMFWEDDHYGALLPGRNMEFRYELVQYLMIVNNLVPPEKLPILWKTLSVGKLTPATSSSFIFAMEAMMNCSPEARNAFDARMMEEYRPMLEGGATSLWETRAGSRDMGGCGSLCHAWSAIATAYCGRYLLGVRPIAPGFCKAAIKVYPGHLTHASGSVPTPHGFIDVRWNLAQGGLELEFSAPKECEVMVEQFEEYPIKQMWRK